MSLGLISRNKVLEIHDNIVAILRKGTAIVLYLPGERIIDPSYTPPTLPGPGQSPMEQAEVISISQVPSCYCISVTLQVELLLGRSF